LYRTRQGASRIKEELLAVQVHDPADALVILADNQ
jgi:hypothetical protein